MTKSSAKVGCACGGGVRRCDGCAERDLEMLIRQCRADSRFQAEESLRETIIIDPRPEAREGRGGFHRRRKVAEPDVMVTDDVVDDSREAREQHISARVAAYKLPEGDALGWCCSLCGPLTDDERPLVDPEGVGYCPRVGCDGIPRLAAK